MRFSQLGIPVVTEFPPFPHVGDIVYLSTGITESFNYSFNGVDWVKQVPGEIITYEPTNYSTSDSSLNAHLEAIDNAITGGGGASGLADLTDVTIAAESVNEILKFNGSQWVNSLVAWSEVTGKPSTFAPAAHTHPASDVVSGTFVNARISQSSVTQWQGVLAIGWGQLTGVPGTFAPTAHNHVLADITDAGALASEADAPIDGNIYAREDGAWTNIEGLKTSTIGAVFDGQGSIVTAGSSTLPISIDFACTIISVRMFSDISTNAVVDVWVDTFTNSPPTVVDTITAADKPTLSAASKVEDLTLTGWTTSIAAGSVLIFKVDSCSAATKLHIQLKILRT